jgi:hypothetical protein
MLKMQVTRIHQGNVSAWVGGVGLGVRGVEGEGEGGFFASLKLSTLIEPALHVGIKWRVNWLKSQIIPQERLIQGQKISTYSTRSRCGFLLKRPNKVWSNDLSE